MTTDEKEVKNCTSDALENILQGLSIDQVRFVVARQEFATDKDAADAIGISPRTVYNWSDKVKEAVQLMALDSLVTAQHLRRRALAKAMLVKYGGLDSGDERLRQGVATEFIEWEMGRAKQHTELTGANNEPVLFRVIRDD